MTTKLIEFDKFKQLVLEATDTDVSYPGAILWTVWYTDGATSAKKNGTLLYFYVALKGDRERLIKSELSGFLVPTLKGRLSMVNWIPNASSINQTDITDRCVYARYYSMFKCVERFEISNNTSQMELFERRCNDAISDFANSRRLYIAFQLKDERTNKNFTNEVDALRAANKAIRNAVEHPDSFVGHDSIKANFRRLVNMSTVDYLKQYGTENILGSLIIKAGLNLFRKRQNDDTPGELSTIQPSWENDLTTFITATRNVRNFVSIQNWIRNDNPSTVIVEVRPISPRVSTCEIHDRQLTFRTGSTGEFKYQLILKSNGTEVGTKDIIFEVKPDSLPPSPSTSNQRRLPITTLSKLIRH